MPNAQQKARTVHQFIPRESLITDHLKDANFKAVHTIFTLLLYVHAVCRITNYFLDPSIFWQDVGYLTWSAPNPHIAIAIGVCMHLLLILIVHPVTWYYVASGFKHETAYVSIIATVLLSLILAPTLAVFKYNIERLSCTVILVEQVRLIMKLISFVIENRRKESYTRVPTLNGENNNCENGHRIPALDMEPGPSPPVLPGFTSFLYYLLSPTLIYRDEYPQAERNYSRILSLLSEMLAHTLAGGYMIKVTAVTFQDIGIKPMRSTNLVTGVFLMTVLGSLFTSAHSYGLNHLYHNIWAEVLAFADRHFYGDYWLEKDFRRKIRSFNLIVNDFLHEYIYHCLRTAGAGRSTSSFAVLTVSGIMHEYIICTSLRFFLPILSVTMSLAIFPERIGNLVLGRSRNASIMFHYVVFVSTYALVVLAYFVEYFCRKNCPLPEDASVWQSLMPRMLQCNIRIE